MKPEISEQSSSIKKSQRIEEGITGTRRSDVYKQIQVKTNPLTYILKATAQKQSGNKKGFCNYYVNNGDHGKTILDQMDLSFNLCNDSYHIRQLKFLCLAKLVQQCLKQSRTKRIIWTTNPA